MTFLLRKIVSCGDPQSPVLCEYYSHLGVRTPELYPPNALPPKKEGCLRIVVLSDTHELHDLIPVPPGDLLIHAGDILFADRFSVSALSRYRLKKFFRWLNRLPHAHKVVVAGNHDMEIFSAGARVIKALAAPAIYAENEIVSLLVDPVRQRRIRILASPWSIANSNRSPNRVFQTRDSVDEMRRFIFADLRAAEQQANGELPSESTAIVRDTAAAIALQREVTIEPATFKSLRNEPIDILVTHQGFFCDALEQLEVDVRPQICHVGGHVHEAHGICRLPKATPSVNGSMMVGTYCREKLLRPIVFDVVITAV